MGLFDRSSSSNVTNLTDATTTNTTQTDQSGGLLTFSDVGGGIGLDLSSHVTDASSHSSSSSTSIANSGNTTLSDSGAVAAGRDLGLAGVNVAGSALTTLQRVNADSLELLAGLASDSIDASRTLARDSAETSRGFLQDAISGFGALAKQTSEGSDDKIARVVGFALAAVAAVIVLPALFKSGGKAAVI